MSLTPAQRALLARIGQHGLRRIYGGRGTRQWVPDGGPAANRAVVERLADAGYIKVTRLGPISELDITPAGREALAEEPVRSSRSA